MNVLGLVFVGTRTRRPDAAARFARDVLGLSGHPLGDTDAVVFDLPDGSAFAVQPAGDDVEERTVGFLVGDVAAAREELRDAGVETDDVAEAGGYRYVHFRGPDGALYELVERCG